MTLMQCVGCSQGFHERGVVVRGVQIEDVNTRALKAGQATAQLLSDTSSR